MADKRISQLVERTDIANNDVLPIVASGATTTNKVTISTIQDWMQDNLDVGVTSVGLTLGTTGTDVNVTGSPITTSGNITINIPDASASNRGVVTTGSQVFGGVKTFANGFILPSAGGTNQASRFLNIGTIHEGSAGSNQIGFNNSNNIYFGKGLSNGGVIQWTNAAVRYYTLPDADGTLALASQLDGYVTLGTAQTITGQKTFNSTIVGQDATLTSSGSNQTLLVTHSSGSGIALDISKGGNGEGLRVAKTSGSGNAVTITGGLLSAEAATLTGALNGTSASFTGQVAATGVSTNAALSITLPGNANATIISSTGSNTGFGWKLQQEEVSTGDWRIFRRESGVDYQVLNLARSTGEATFSSSVTALGNLSVGSTSSAARLEVASGVSFSSEVQRWSYNDANAAYSLRLKQDVSGGLVKHIFDLVNNSTTYSNNLVLTNGNVGIGTASPSFKLDIEGTSVIARVSDPNTSGLNRAAGYRAQTNTSFGDFLSIANNANAPFNSNDGVYVMNRTSGSNLYFTTNNGGTEAERMRITSDGFIFTESQLQISSGLASGKLNIGALLNSGQNCITLESFQSPGGGNFIQFLNNAGGVAGSITHNGTTIVAYNITSDYRLKEDLQEIKGLEKVQAIKVYNYKWIGEESRMDGVLAHELAEVLPYAVTGDKDEMYENGKERMQAVDYSKIVPILIKAIQEQQEQIDSLKNQIK
jgi:hypothetical protein